MTYLLEKLINLIFNIIPQKKPQQHTLQNARIIAHRGIHNSTITENTVEAFDAALENGCYGIELDVHNTKDNECVVNHDSDCKRIWKKNLIINKSSLKTIKDKVPEIPALNEIITKYGKKMHLFIELKPSFQAFKKLQEILCTLTPAVDYHILTTERKLLPLMGQYFPEHAIFPAATEINFFVFYKIAREKPYAGWLGHYLLIHKKQIAQLSSENKFTGVGFVESENSLYRELNRGVYYIFTNNAAKINNLLKKQIHK